MFLAFTASSVDGEDFSWKLSGEFSWTGKEEELLSNGNLGRDFLTGCFSWTWYVPLDPLFLATLPSRLSRPGQALQELWSSESDVAGVLLRLLSFGDLGFVVGIFKQHPTSSCHLSNKIWEKAVMEKEGSPFLTAVSVVEVLGKN